MAKPSRKLSTASKSAPNPADDILHLGRWIQANKQHLLPPVSNKQLFANSLDAVVFVSGGPNTRNDYHVNPTEELFFQIKGDIAVRIRPLDGAPPRDVIIKEGELYLLPRWLPHRPQRPAGTLGLIIEFPRPIGELDALRWYCPKCDDLVHEEQWRLKKIDEDLKIIMHDFWDGPAERRTCKKCGHLIERAGSIELKAGVVTPGKSGVAKRKAKSPKARPSPATKAKAKATKPAAKGKSAPARRTSR